MPNLNKHIIFFIFLIISSVLWWAFYLLNHFPKKHYGVEINFSKSNSAIIVLTGGKGRFEKGFSLLRKNLSDKLFVSGVYPGVNLEESFTLDPQDKELFNCCVFMDNKSTNTEQNAEQANKWLSKNNINKIFLVSSYYHLPRARILFEKEMPEKQIKLVSVDEKFLNKKNFLDYIFNIKLIITEYFKILFILIFK